MEGEKKNSWEAFPLLRQVNKSFLFLDFFHECISGDLYQLPPVQDSIITEKNHMDGRVDFSPSHWNEHFKIFYLTEKMRSMKDPVFSALCDRVGIGEVTKSDEDSLRSRILPCPEEHQNENFKNGSLSIIVTTNKKKDLINNQKLTDLLPDEKEFICNSIDRVKNVPNQKIPDKIKENPGKTGNLQTQLRLRKNAPVLMTVNHPKKKYKEDGLTNGARGYIQSIQTAKSDPDKVEVIWVVFKNPNIGKLYRFDHKHLRENYNPGHKLACPILPERKDFKDKYGNIEYQRTNFPLTLCYAMTAHKCQGDTLDKVIIDFGADKEHKIKNYICPGSFYVALTRVREGANVYLKNFDPSYIVVNKKIKSRIEAMKKFSPYQFKKIYLDDQIFKHRDLELKIGYLNINGLVDGNHIEYLNADHNLRNLDFMVIAETKLDVHCKTSSLTNILDNWDICARHDSDDQLKHMGMVVLASKRKLSKDQVKDISYLQANRNGKLQFQSIVIKVKSDLQVGFVYSRSSPTNEEIKSMKKLFNQCQIIMGDLNLSHRLKVDMDKVEQLCDGKRISLLQEITRCQSYNQLDYILINNNLADISFATSYKNMISDHNSITVRIGLDNNVFSDNTKEKINFDRESHLKEKLNNQVRNLHTNNDICMDIDMNEPPYSSSDDDVQIFLEKETLDSTDKIFTRKFLNLDATSCWLNSSLQLVLAALDHSIESTSFSSDLGLELIRLKSSPSAYLDATEVKNILVSVEDLRIATRISEINDEVKDPILLKRRLQNIEDLRLNLISGQQCIRDFFLCISENPLAWPDVYLCLSFSTSYFSSCTLCEDETEWNTVQTYIELDVPADNSNLHSAVQNYLNETSMNSQFCESCKSNVKKLRTNRITSIEDTPFITIMLRRAIDSQDGLMLNKNSVISTNNILLR